MPSLISQLAISSANLCQQFQKGKQKSPGRATSRSRSQPPTPGGRGKRTQINACIANKQMHDKHKDQLQKLQKLQTMLNVLAYKHLSQITPRNSGLISSQSPYHIDWAIKHQLSQPTTVQSCHMHYTLSLVRRKPVLCHMRTTKTQISLRICAV